LIPVAVAQPSADAVGAIHESPLRDLRYVIFGGEALELSSLRPWFDRFGDERPRLVNMYGITETTVHVTYRPIGRADLRKGSVIGVPIPDLRVHILDARRQPVPIGVTGEIHVGGAGVAMGYLNRPELTAERFVQLDVDPVGAGLSPAPTGSSSKMIFYRSGDLGRYLPNGEIEYLGRIDHQVKIRGFRIELGEIESVLLAHEAIREALVIATEGEDGIRLAAYLSPVPGLTLDPADLRAFMKRHIPDYMVPAVFVPLDAFPLTEHGKIDRKRLPDPDAARHAAAVTTVEEPGTTTEVLIAEMMIGILGVPRIGLAENFFDIGAQSLIIVRAHAKLKERLDRDFPLIALYQHPTVKALAAHLDGTSESAGVTADADERAAKARAARERRRKP
jgi:acyl-CoA synthetase (AMP-forming)/AMP-acid ligase II